MTTLDRINLLFIAGQAVAPMIRLLPVILKFFPELLRDTPKITLGRVIPILGTDPTSDQLLDQALARRPKYDRKKPKKRKDSSLVITVEDAIKCVEDTVNDPKTCRLGVLRLAAQVINPTTGDSPIGDRLVQCFRDKALKQTAARKYTTYRYPKREI
jgi:hypothetical protein